MTIYIIFFNISVTNKVFKVNINTLVVFLHIIEKDYFFTWTKRTPCIYTTTYTHTHTHTHTLTHTYTNPHTLTHTHTNPHPHIHTHTNTIQIYIHLYSPVSLTLI